MTMPQAASGADPEAQSTSAKPTPQDTRATSSDGPDATPVSSPPPDDTGGPASTPASTPVSSPLLGDAGGPAVPVAVIGAGAMGRGIAQVAAQAGHPVVLVDSQPGAADRASAARPARAVTAARPVRHPGGRATHPRPSCLRTSDDPPRRRLPRAP